MFPFRDICDLPVAAADYIALCQQFHTLVVDGVPQFHAGNRSTAYRFVTLVDVVYEERVRLICAAEVPPDALFQRVMTNVQFREAGRRVFLLPMPDQC